MTLSHVIQTRPLLTLSMLLLLPSFMTLTTLIVHRIRQARAEQRDRAPEETVISLPSGVWTGDGLVFDDAEKQLNLIPILSPPTTPTSPSLPSPNSTVDTDIRVERTDAEGSTPAPVPPPVPKGRRRFLRKAWFATQSECAICLSDFEKGDRLRILPCGHIFHLDEVDPWLIQRKKLVGYFLVILIILRVSADAFDFDALSVQFAKRISRLLRHGAQRLLRPSVPDAHVHLPCRLLLRPPLRHNQRNLHLCNLIKTRRQQNAHHCWQIVDDHE